MSAVVLDERCGRSVRNCHTARLKFNLAIQMPSTPYNYFPAASQPFCWAVGVFIALFGVGFVLTGLDVVGYSPLTGSGQVVLGGVVLFLAWRVARYPARATLSIAEDALILRPAFWLSSRLDFSEMTALGLYRQQNQARLITGSHSGRLPGMSVTSEHLVVTLSGGRTRTITLPGFNNQHLLSKLTDRTGLRIEHLPGRMAG